MHSTKMKDNVLFLSCIEWNIFKMRYGNSLVSNGVQAHNVVYHQLTRVLLLAEVDDGKGSIVPFIFEGIARKRGANWYRMVHIWYEKVNELKSILPELNNLEQWA